jgi:hypothetical protein
MVMSLRWLHWLGRMGKLLTRRRFESGGLFSFIVSRISSTEWWVVRLLVVTRALLLLFLSR